MKKFLLPIMTVVISLSMVSCGGDEAAEGDDKGGEKKKQKKEACTYEFDMESTDVRWISYKTEEKVPVEGTFDQVELKGASTSEDPLGVLKSLELNVIAESVNSNDSTRDAKLRKFFFGNMDGAWLQGSVHEINADGTGTAKIKMNGQEKDIAFEYKLDGENVTASFDINMMEFGADSAHAALNKACDLKHRGDDPEKPSVLWEDVRVVVTTTLKKNCE